MAKSKPIIKILSFGIYNQWNSKEKILPKIQQFTTKIEASLDIEFGFIINIKKAKGEKVQYCIYHPDIPDNNGNPLAPFDGEVFITSNDWDFYLGDTIWLPIENKLGIWRMTIELKGKIIAEKKFVVGNDFPSKYQYYVNNF
jgi:hypothetical protein